MRSLSRLNRQCTATGMVLLFLLFIIYSTSTTLFTQKMNNLRRYTTPSIHLVTGLLVNPDQAWNGDDGRKDENGAWLLDPLLDGINKTVYNSDIYISQMMT